MSAWASGGFIALGAVTVLVHQALPEPGAKLLYDAHALATLAVVVRGLVVHRPAHRRVWYLTITALALWVVANAVATANLYLLARPSPRDGTVEIAEMLGYVALLAAAICLIQQGGDGDRGGVLDAAVLAVAGGTLVWELLVYPNVVGAGALDLLVCLVQLLCIMGMAGALLRATKVSPQSRSTLMLFTAALGCVLVGNIGYLLTHRTLEYVPGSWTDQVFILSSSLMGAAALHPAMARLGLDRRVVDAQLHDRRLLALTAALVCAPVVVGVCSALGRGTDTMLLAVASVVTVPLVMVRIRGLVQERETAQAALAHQATHDALTGLFNRAELLRRLDAARDAVASGASSGLCLVFLDLDGFKLVNDTLGHAAGDQLLTVVADRVRACVRATDAVARLGGDEFVVLREDGDPGAAQAVADRLAATLGEPVQLDGGPARIGASIGVVTGTGPAIPDGAALLGSADAAMYRAKRAARAARAAR